MLKHSDLKRGLCIILDDEPYEVLETTMMKKAQRRLVIQTKVKNLIKGNVFSKNFHQGDVFEEAELDQTQAKFLYNHRDKFVFCLKDNPSQRHELSEQEIDFGVDLLKANQLVKLFLFNEKVIRVSLPIKIELKVVEAPPGIQGDRASAGTKQVILETGAKLDVPLFVKEGDLVEINTESKEYVRRVK